MNDQRLNKKKEEVQILYYFLEAYHLATGVELDLLRSSERPDFICEAPDNSKIGIELTKVTRGDPEQILWDRILERREHMLPEKAIEKIQWLTIEKEDKKSQGDWKCSDNTILVIELVDIPLYELRSLLEDNTNLPDIDNLSFVEIWLGDYTEIEAYDNIELFCLYPGRLRGYYQRHNPMQKPYG